jgi:transposase-like protein
MHDTHLPLWKWFLTVYMIVESKKAVSANQIKRMIEVSYKTAWYLCHRIRAALLQPHALLSGIVEIDETWVGPKAKRGPGNGRRGEKRYANKSLLMGVKERGENGRVQIQAHDGTATRETIREFLKRHIGPDVNAIYSDKNPSYGKLHGKGRDHRVVNHGKEEWVRGQVHTNSIESVWGLFKRSIVGSFHKISHKHLDRYIDEFEFRFNNRNNPYIFRDAMQELLTCGNLEYRDLIGKPA